MPCPALPALPRPSLPCPALACPAVFNVKLSGLNQIHAGNTPWQVWLACLNPLCSCTNGFLHCMLLCFTSALKHSTGAQKASEWLSGQSPLSSAAVCKTVCQQACVSANTPVEICCSCSCAMTHDKCTATLFLAKSSHHCPVLLYAKQVASRHVSVQIHLWRFAAHTAVQSWTSVLQHFLAKSSHHGPELLYAIQVASRVVSAQRHLWRFAVHTAVQ